MQNMENCPRAERVKVDDILLNNRLVCVLLGSLMCLWAGGGCAGPTGAETGALKGSLRSQAEPSTDHELSVDSAAVTIKKNTIPPDENPSCEQLIAALEPAVGSKELKRYYRVLPEILISANIVPALYLKAPDRAGGPEVRAVREALARRGTCVTS